VAIPDGEIKLKIYLFVSTEYMDVTDGRTDRHRATVSRPQKVWKTCVDVVQREP